MKSLTLCELCANVLFMEITIRNISRGTRPLSRRNNVRRGLHLIDIENLCGSSLPTKDDVENARKRYFSVAPFHPGDHVIVASARINLLNSGLGWPKARLLARDGRNGADICLSDVVRHEDVERRFDTVVLASGDGGLAFDIARLGSAGLHTVVVAQQSRLSRQLRIAADRCIVLHDYKKKVA